MTGKGRQGESKNDDKKGQANKASSSNGYRRSFDCAEGQAQRGQCLRGAVRLNASSKKRRQIKSEKKNEQAKGKAVQPRRQTADGRTSPTRRSSSKDDESSKAGEKRSAEGKQIR